jgi:hypothetical protein
MICLEILISILVITPLFLAECSRPADEKPPLRIISRGRLIFPSAAHPDIDVAIEGHGSTRVMCQPAPGYQPGEQAKDLITPEEVQRIPLTTQPLEGSSPS